MIIVSNRTDLQLHTFRAPGDALHRAFQVPHDGLECPRLLIEIDSKDPDTKYRVQYIIIAPDKALTGEVYETQIDTAEELDRVMLRETSLEGATLVHYSIEHIEGEFTVDGVYLGDEQGEADLRRAMAERAKS
jgi:hypothetical protein